VWHVYRGTASDVEVFIPGSPLLDVRLICDADAATAYDSPSQTGLLMGLLGLLFIELALITLLAVRLTGLHGNRSYRLKIPE
jgi:hypothetical protein